MRIVSVEELINQKILPFDLYNSDGEKLFSAGEVLTPGKLLQLRYISVLYTDDIESFEETVEETIVIEEEDDDIDLQEIKVPDQEEKEDKKEQFSVIEHPADAPIENETSCIPVTTQRDIREMYKKALMSAVEEENLQKQTGLYLEARDKIVEEILPIVDDVAYKSQLKVFGDYDYAHGVNVSILSTMLGYKLKYNESQIRDIALAALLHDIGKIKIPKDILEKTAPSAKETKLIQLHTQVGYKILKKEMGLPEHIARVALEHHERNDGSGYPYGISGDLISTTTQVVIVCDVYDALTSNRGHIKVKNAKEAMRVMMDIGTKWFMPNPLYTFVHMSNYNDTTPLNNTYT